MEKAIAEKSVVASLYLNKLHIIFIFHKNILHI